MNTTHTDINHVGGGRGEEDKKEVAGGDWNERYVGQFEATGECAGVAAAT